MEDTTIGMIEFCEFRRKKNGDKECGLLLNEGELKIISSQGETLETVYEYRRLGHIFTLDMTLIFQHHQEILNDENFKKRIEKEIQKYDKEYFAGHQSLRNVLRKLKDCMERKHTAEHRGNMEAFGIANKHLLACKSQPFPNLGEFLKFIRKGI